METCQTFPLSNKLRQGQSWLPKKNNRQFRDWQLWDSVNWRQPKLTWLVIRMSNWQRICCLTDWPTVISIWKCQNKEEIIIKGGTTKEDKVDRVDRVITKMMTTICSIERHS